MPTAELGHVRTYGLLHRGARDLLRQLHEQGYWSRGTLATTGIDIAESNSRTSDRTRPLDARDVCLALCDPHSRAEEAQHRLRSSPFSSEEFHAQLPAEVRWKADNYNNLLEQPTIFYAVALTLAFLNAGSGLQRGLSMALRCAADLPQPRPGTREQGHDQVCALCRCVHRFVGYGGPCRVDYAVIKVCAATLSIPTTQTSAQIHDRNGSSSAVERRRK